MNILAIDPSAHNIGFALLQMPNIWIAGTHYTDGEESIQRRAQTAWNQIKKRLRLSEINQIIIEYPCFMASAKGLIAAQKGYTIDIAFFVGYFVALSEVNPANVTLLTPQQWKGNKPKTATQAAFKRIFPDMQKQNLDEHAIDALMLLHSQV